MAGEARRRERPIRVGVSACLLGDQVRHDGGHKRDSFLADVLGRHVEWVKVCPEMELGLGSPRDSLRLVVPAAGAARRGGDNQAPRLIAPRTGRELTASMRSHAQRRARSLAAEDLCGFVLKSRSPSCGMQGVPLYEDGSAEAGVASRDGRGLFAAALIARFPLLPVEEEGRLADPRLRGSFLERVLAYRRLRRLLRGRLTPARLKAFHDAHELQLQAHAPYRCRALGRLVARAGPSLPRALRDDYATGFMAVLATPATPAGNASVLRRVLGEVRHELDAASRAELAAVIEDHRRGHAPLAVPLSLLRPHLDRLAIDGLAGQTYLEPHPLEHLLRDHV